jgi:hypothetical protein
VRLIEMVRQQYRLQRVPATRNFILNAGVTFGHRQPKVAMHDHAEFWCSMAGNWSR